MCTHSTDATCILYQIIASLVQIHDDVWFIDNETPDGGALYINSFGQIQMFSNSSMTFERNKGRYVLICQ